MGRQASSFVLRPWGGKLVVCITSVGWHACSFVLRPFGGKLVALLPVWRQARSFCCLCGSELVVFRLCGYQLVCLC